ncbi:MAG: GNAT family N-acetyltransferase [Mucilaginibacter polytrichastri]|nr:GNAT family N-acetyltransferase [Mucilaginibacter polytrichastri]
MPARTYRIETARLVIRCYEPGDAELLWHAVNESLDHIRPWIPFARYEPTSLMEKKALVRKFRGEFDLGINYVFGIFDKQNGDFLGGTGFHLRAGKDAAEIGYWIHVDQTGKGIATEAVQALLQIAFCVERWNHIVIHCDPENAGSARIAAKLGFRHTVTQDTTAQDGSPQDTMVWLLYRSEYEKMQGEKGSVRAFDFSGGLISY